MFSGASDCAVYITALFLNKKSTNVKNALINSSYRLIVKDTSYEPSPKLNSIHQFSLRHVAEGHGVYIQNHKKTVLLRGLFVQFFKISMKRSIAASFDGLDQLFDHQINSFFAKQVARLLGKA